MREGREKRRKKKGDQGLEAWIKAENLRILQNLEVSKVRVSFFKPNKVL